MFRTILLSIVLVGTAAAAHAFHLEGRYLDEYHTMIYEVETDGADVLLRRGRFGQWQRFIPHRKNAFVNRTGDLLRVERNSLVLDKRNHIVYLRRVDDHHGEWDHYHVRHKGASLLHGNWYSGHGRNRIRVTSYKNGLKVTSYHRHGSTSEFYHLVRDWDRLQVFRTDCGKTLTYDRHGRLLWTDASGHGQIEFYQ